MNQSVIESIKYLRNTGQLQEASDLIKTQKSDNNTTGQWSLLALMFYDMHDYEEAIYATRKAIETSDSKQDIFCHKANLAKFYNDNNEPHKALEVVQDVPITDDIKVSKAFSYLLLNQKDRSKNLYREIIRSPKTPFSIRGTANYNLAVISMQDDWLKSMLDLSDFGTLTGIHPALPRPWTGADLEGQSLIVISNSGLGDDIINVRFCEYLDKKGIDYIWLSQKEKTQQIGNLFSRHGVKYLDDHTKVSKNSYVTLSDFLPLWLGLTPQSLWKGAYLKPSQNYLEKWKWLHDLPDKRLGIRWTGNTQYVRNKCRDLPLPELIEELKDYTLISLQKDDGVEELKAHKNVLDISEKIQSFEDTLAIMHYLEAVVTSCTSVAHAAGAMDKKCYAFIPINTYYVWETDTGFKSSWYGENFTTLRQKTYGSWTSEIQQLRKLLNGV